MQALTQFQKYIKLTCTEFEFKSNCYYYKISVYFTGQKQKKYEIERTKKEIQIFHQSITKYIFELDNPFDKKQTDKEDASQTAVMINIYLSHVQERLDCLTQKHSIIFFQFDKELQDAKILSKEYVEELTEVNINSNDEEVVDVQWEPQEKILFVVSQCKKKKKIQNFFKLFISNETGMNGSLQMIKFSQKKNLWVIIASQLIEAQPISITWNSKSSILVVSTTIGIYVYMIGRGTQQSTMNLIDFVEIPGISSISIDSQIASIYVLSNGINYQSKSKLYAYSIKKQSAVEIPSKLTKAQSIVFEKFYRRLYISDDEGIKIFKIENDSQKLILQNFKKLHTINHDSFFEKLVLSSEEKPEYLFGYNKKGFITVFEIKPPEKQFLMNVLTNVECPGNYTSIERIWSKKMFCVNFDTHLVFISMKNQPIWVKQNGIGAGKVKKIIFDQQNQRLMYSDNNKLKICQLQF